MDPAPLPTLCPHPAMDTVSTSRYPQRDVDTATHTVSTSPDTVWVSRYPHCVHIPLSTLCPHPAIHSVGSHIPLHTVSTSRYPHSVHSGLPQCGYGMFHIPLHTVSTSRYGHCVHMWLSTCVWTHPASGMWTHPAGCPHPASGMLTQCGYPHVSTSRYPHVYPHPAIHIPLHTVDTSR